MLKTKDIIDEKNKLLRTVSKEVVFPLTDEDRKTINDIIEYASTDKLILSAKIVSIAVNGLASCRNLSNEYEVSPSLIILYVSCA